VCFVGDNAQKAATPMCLSNASSENGVASSSKFDPQSSGIRVAREVVNMGEGWAGNMQGLTIAATPRTYPFISEFHGKLVTFRRMAAEDKELFRSFIRSLPAKDNYYLLLDVRSDIAIDRWAEEVAYGHTLGVVALDGADMVGYCSVDTSELPWTRHTGEIRMSTALAYRGLGIGRALAHEVFGIARARGLEKIWSRMAAGQTASQNVFESLGFHAEAVLSNFVKNEDGLTEDLVMMSYDAGEPWGL
jgi:ribosomal protein S18 acetylase RimI-like enzyme